MPVPVPVPRLPTGAPLVGRNVRLDPLTETDLPALHPLLSDAAVYRHGYVMHRRPGSLDDAVELARTRFLGTEAPPDGSGRGRTPYAVRLVHEGRDIEDGGDSPDGPDSRTGTLVGTSSLLEAHLANGSIHLGSTLYGRAWWGTAVNPETKLLLLTHCFEHCGFQRVKLQTDALNTRSQAAIERLGATREGVLRRDVRREDGSFRDTVVFSILSDEWPAVKAALIDRLALALPFGP